MKKLLLCIPVMLMISGVCAQTYSIFPGTSSDPSCPGARRTYKVVISEGTLPGCTYTWTAVNGSFPDNSSHTTYSGSNLRSVDVKWDDTFYGGTLKVEVSGCPGNSPIGELASNNYSIATFFKSPVLQENSAEINIPENHDSLFIEWNFTKLTQFLVKQ